MFYIEDIEYSYSKSKDLLRAYYHQLPTDFAGGALLIKSSSLTSLMNFYEILLTDYGFHAGEIISLKKNKTHFGLLKGINKDFSTPEDIECRWFEPGESLAGIYQS